MKEKKLLCYSHNDFVSEMSRLGWTERPASDACVVSISSHLDKEVMMPSGNYGHHLFPDSDNVLNIDFCDCTPEIWWDGRDRYDELQEFFVLNQSDKTTEDDRRFSYKSENYGLITCMNYEQAVKIVRFIDSHIQRDVNTIYVHCSAGRSRSQGVVRYVLDTYPDISWTTNPLNPCLTPNYYVVRMLKRAYRLLFIPESEPVDIV